MFLSESEASVFLGRILQEKEMGITIIEKIVNGLIKEENINPSILPETQRLKR